MWQGQPLRASPCGGCVLRFAAAAGRPSQRLREAQLADSLLGPILRGKETRVKPSTGDPGAVSRSFRRESPDGGMATMQVVVPKALHGEALHDLHEGALGGHFGIDKTLARLKERFYWPGHHNDVHDWSPAPKARAPLKSIETGYPLQLVAMDIVGPFPESPAGNTHILVVADYFTR